MENAIANSIFNKASFVFRVNVTSQDTGVLPGPGALRAVDLSGRKGRGKGGRKDRER